MELITFKTDRENPSSSPTQTLLIKKFEKGFFVYTIVNKHKKTGKKTA